jgi:hypothetical protein
MFPTMSLGPPANLTSSEHQASASASASTQFNNLPPANNITSVLTAIRNSTSPNETTRRPSEQLLQSWGDYYTATSSSNGYLGSLLHIINGGVAPNNTAAAAAADGSIVEDSSKLMAAILLKNNVPKLFSISSDDSNNNNNTDTTATVTEEVNNEKMFIRQTLFQLLFQGVASHSLNPTLVLHLQLAISNIALFDFPLGWSTLLDDLLSVVSTADTTITGGGVIGGMVRVRAIKTLRMCLSSIRHRKLIVKDRTPRNNNNKRGGGGSRPNPIMDMRNLEAMIGKAVHERKEVHMKACAIFDGLAEGIVRHTQLAVTGGSSSSSVVGNVGDAHTSWQIECMLATSHIKCMTELFPMLEIEQVHTDPRVPAVRTLLDNLSQICQAVKSYPVVSIPPSLLSSSSSSSSIQQEMTIQMDKLYRSTLVCCMMSIRHQPQLFATQIPSILPSIVEPILTLDSDVLQSMPVKRLINMTNFIQLVVMCKLYDERRKDRFGGGGGKNAVLAMLMGRRGGGSGGGDDGSTSENDATNPDNDPAVIAARKTVTALLAEGTIERLIECIVGKFLMLHPDEVEEWESDPEGRYETDLAEEAILDAQSPRHCGGALLMTLMNLETDVVSKALLDLTQRVFQQLPQDDVNAMLSREACYRALELCQNSMIGTGQRRLNFSDWFQAELLPILQTELAENSPVAMRAMQARAVTLTQAYAQSLKGEEFEVAFQCIAKLMAAPDLVTALCSSRCIDHLAILSVRDREEGKDDSPQLLAVRSHSVFALGNAFALANRAESEECVRVILMCVSALVEANGVYLEPVLQAIAEQLPSLWERAGDSVPIHSCLLSVLNHLIMKMGYSTVENSHVQAVLFPLLDYCTDITVVNRAETLLEDGLRLWLVTLLSSRVATMGPRLTSMLPRLELILRSGLEPHLSLKVLQFYAILIGKQVIEPLGDFLRELLVRMTSSVHTKPGEKDAAGDEMEDDSTSNSKEGSSKEKDIGTMRDAIAALSFAGNLMQLFPDLGYSIASPAIGKVIVFLGNSGTKETGSRHLSVSLPLLQVALSAFGRMLWINPNSFDELFPQQQQQQQQQQDSSSSDAKIAFLVKTWLGIVSSVSFAVMVSKRAQTIMFIDQKGAALALCSTVCRSPTVQRVAGTQIASFTKELLEVEERGNISMDALVEAACGATRQVVGDGPLGDAASMTAEILKSDPLLSVSLKEALDNATKALGSVAWA